MVDSAESVRKADLSMQRWAGGFSLGLALFVPALVFVAPYITVVLWWIWLISPFVVAPGEVVALILGIIGRHSLAGKFGIVVSTLLLGLCAWWIFGLHLGS